MDNYIVQTNHLKKYYQMGKNTIRALDGVDFCVKEHEFVAIIRQERLRQKYTAAYARGT